MRVKEKVILVDLDASKRKGVFPNLALMKLSAWHKGQGDEVLFNAPLLIGDTIYASCVFTWNRHKLDALPPHAVIGGIGLPQHNFLAPEIEHIMPDYTLYPHTDSSYGFTSRGCNRKCPWCKVPKKEGRIRPTADFHEFWDRRHDKLILLDNNLLMSPNWKETLEGIAKEGVEVDFNQGLDIRSVNDEVAWYLSRIRTKKLRFAFDSLSYENAVRKGIRHLSEEGIATRHLSFYVLTGYDNDETVVERIRILSSLNVDIYPMIFRDDDGNEPTRKLIWNPALEGIKLHGSRPVIKRFLRLVGRLPG